MSHDHLPPARPIDAELRPAEATAALLKTHMATAVIMKREIGVSGSVHTSNYANCEERQTSYMLVNPDATITAFPEEGYKVTSKFYNPKVAGTEPSHKAFSTISVDGNKYTIKSDGSIVREGDTDNAITEEEDHHIREIVRLGNVSIDGLFTNEKGKIPKIRRGMGFSARLGRWLNGE